MNKIFHLRPTAKGEKHTNRYDSYSDWVIISKDEDTARRMTSCGDECYNINHQFCSDKSTCFWVNKELTEAIVLGETELGEQVVCSSFHAG